MAPLSFYDISIPTFRNGLETLAQILSKAEQHAKEKGLNVDDYVNASLADDMKGLSFQVQTVSNTAKKSVWRLTGDETAPWADDETTFEQLKARVQKTLDLVKSVDRAKIDGKEDEKVGL